MLRFHTFLKLDETWFQQDTCAPMLTRILFPRTNSANICDNSQNVRAGCRPVCLGKNTWDHVC